MRAGQKIALRDEVRNALLLILRDASSPATAKASAARTLCEYFGDEAGSDQGKRIEDMSAAEIDAEIASIQGKKR
jgi:hypothetical protein